MAENVGTGVSLSYTDSQHEPDFKAVDPQVPQTVTPEQWRGGKALSFI